MKGYIVAVALGAVAGLTFARFVVLALQAVFS